MKRNKHTSTADRHSLLYATGIGVAISTTISIILTAILTSLVMSGSIQEGSANTLIFLIRTISVLAGCLVGTSIKKEKCLPVIGAITLGYLIILIGVGITFYNGSFQHFGSSVLSIVIGGLVTHLIQLRPKTNRKYAAKYNR